MVSFDSLPYALKLAIVKKSELKVFINLHQTCKSVHTFLLEHGHQVKYKLGINSIISIFTEDNLVNIRLISTPKIKGRATYEAGEILPWIIPFYFGTCNLKMESHRTNAYEKMKIILSFLKTFNWRNFANKLQVRDTKKEDLIELIELIQPSKLDYNQLFEKHLLDQDHIVHPSFTAIKKLEVTTFDGRRGDIALNMLGVIRTFEIINFAFVNWLEFEDMLHIIQRWTTGLDIGRLRSITYDYAHDWIQHRDQLDQFFNTVHCFWMGSDYTRSDGITKLWVLRRAGKNGEEFALAILSRWKQLTGLFIVSDNWEDLIPQIAIETSMEKEHVQIKLQNFLHM